MSTEYLAYVLRDVAYDFADAEIANLISDISDLAEYLGKWKDGDICEESYRKEVRKKRRQSDDKRRNREKGAISK